ncbi:hypothetical protein F0562_013660 [Nyssa sinensis]|uniref:Uncharacterized protein n=1 Tax=Nyssa sinensis TaxID=561372 RepID=A0A5J4ZNJ9_9ASTE|nr:hypothetical protein F0562_013660 [Nyssa sinensis]
MIGGASVGIPIGISGSMVCSVKRRHVVGHGLIGLIKLVETLDSEMTSFATDLACWASTTRITMTNTVAPTTTRGTEVDGARLGLYKIIVIESASAGWISGLVQTLLFDSFFYYYFQSYKNNVKLLIMSGFGFCI